MHVARYASTRTYIYMYVYPQLTATGALTQNFSNHEQQC